MFLIHVWGNAGTASMMMKEFFMGKDGMALQYIPFSKSVHCLQAGTWAAGLFLHKG